MGTGRRAERRNKLHTHLIVLAAFEGPLKIIGCG